MPKEYSKHFSMIPASSLFGPRFAACPRQRWDGDGGPLRYGDPVRIPYNVNRTFPANRPHAKRGGPTAFLTLECTCQTQNCGAPSTSRRRLHHKNIGESKLEKKTHNVLAAKRTHSWAWAWAPVVPPAGSQGCGSSEIGAFLERFCALALLPSGFPRPINRDGKRERDTIHGLGNATLERKKVTTNIP